MRQHLNAACVAVIDKDHFFTNGCVEGTLHGKRAERSNFSNAHIPKAYRNSVGKLIFLEVGHPGTHKNHYLI